MLGRFSFAKRHPKTFTNCDVRRCDREWPVNVDSGRPECANSGYSARGRSPVLVSTNNHAVDTASIAGLMMTTDAMMAERRKKKGGSGHARWRNGMDYLIIRPARGRWRDRGLRSVGLRARGDRARLAANGFERLCCVGPAKNLSVGRRKRVAPSYRAKPRYERRSPFNRTFGATTRGSER